MGTPKTPSGLAIALTLLALTMADTSLVRAQPNDAVAASTPAPGQLEEVIVTAQRRQESLQDVPVSATAVSGLQLERAQITDIGGLQNLAPGLTTATTIVDPTELFIAIRGQVANTAEPTIDPAVGVYVDGVYYARTAGVNAQLVDMQSAEVLRGPQGTLFGRNTIGGAVNITSNKPTNTLAGSVKVDIGSYNTKNVTSIANIPVSDSFQIRAVFNHQQHSGYGSDAFLGVPLKDQKLDFGRITARMSPVESTELLVETDYMVNEHHPLITRPGYLSPTSFLIPIFPTVLAAENQIRSANFYTNEADFAPRAQERGFDTSATLTTDLGWGTFKSITGYRNFRRNDAVDMDGTQFPLIEFVGADLAYHQISEELQLYGNSFENHLRWIGGFYYFDESGNNQIATVVGSAFPISDALTPYYMNESESVYAQVNHDIIDHLDLFAGVRYVDDTRNVHYQNLTVGPTSVTCGSTATFPGAPAGTCVYAVNTIDFRYVPFTAGAEFKPTPAFMAYVKASKGFRSGGFPASAGKVVQTTNPFQPEDVISYEIGAKTEMLDRRLRVNAALFHTSYSNVQINQNLANPNGSVYQTTLNIGKARMLGGELELTALLGDFRLTAGLSSLDAKYTEGPYTNLYPILYSPHTTANGAADYPLITPFGSIDLHADYSWRSVQYFYQWVPGPAAQDATQIAPYGLLNAAIVFHFHATPLQLSIWGKNVTAKKYIAGGNSQPCPVCTVNQIVGDPRTYGVSAAYDFGHGGR